MLFAEAFSVEIGAFLQEKRLSKFYHTLLIPSSHSCHFLETWVKISENGKMNIYQFIDLLFLVWGLMLLSILFQPYDNQLT